MSFQDDQGREVLVPTVVNGQFLTQQQAMDRYYKTGQHLGIFDTPQHADAYASALHQSQEAMGGFYGATSQKVEVPGLGVVDFPALMPAHEMAAAINRHLATRRTPAPEPWLSTIPDTARQAILGEVKRQ